jgi:hypothetical protein
MVRPGARSVQADAAPAPALVNQTDSKACASGAPMFSAGCLASDKALDRTQRGVCNFTESVAAIGALEFGGYAACAQRCNIVLRKLGHCIGVLLAG